MMAHLFMLATCILHVESLKMHSSLHSRGSCAARPTRPQRIVGLVDRDSLDLQLHFHAQLSGLATLRGGALETEEEEEDDDDNGDERFVVMALRSLIKSALGISGPTLGSPIKLLAIVMESIMGVPLLPEPPAKRRRRRKVDTPVATGKKKSKMKKKKSVKQEVASADGDETRSEEIVTKSPSQKKKKAATRKTRPTSAAASNHLKNKLSSTNPNYRVQSELRKFMEDPPQGLRVHVGKNLRVWIVDMQGVGIYKDEKFKLRVKFPATYPAMPPSIYFLPPNIPTHEHVYTNGDICLSLLGKDWRPTMTAQSIVLSIQSILGSAHKKLLPMDNAKHAQNKPGEYQKDWVYHDDLC